MASTSNLQLTAPSSSPSSWDVFLSFYGKDTRAGFISHLYNALDQAGFVTFRDDPALEKGQEISSGLLDAIRDSKMFVVVISENYARSPWCLDELVEILRCNKTGNQVVPIFYYVDPSDVRYRKRSFEEAFQDHVDKKRYSDDMIDKWKSALAQIAQLSGHHLKKDANENEAETIQKIVKNVAGQVSTKVLHLEKGLFGLDCAVEEIYQKMRMESNHVRAVGICGMGGIGKTTTAKAFYNKYSNRFDISCFIDKVKQYSQGGSPLLPLLNQVLTGLLRKQDYKVTDVESGFRQLKHILGFKKALIVLDDLDQASYSEFLVTVCNSFSAGSRIIVTTRDGWLVDQLRSDITEVDTYMVKKLGQVDSLELFSYHAFRTHMPPANLRVLSESFVTYAGGLPLALKVLGSSLHRRTHDVLFWKAKLDKVKKIPENEIMKTLQLSYDELDCDTYKALFLDIACFFVGKKIHDAVEIFKSCDFFPEEGIPILVERCLLTIDEEDKFHMHDLLQDMGRKLGNSTRLIWPGNALSELQKQKGIEKIEVLVLDLTLSKEKFISSEIFEKLPKLRLLEIFSARGGDFTNIEGDFTNSFHELKCIYWNYCGWRQLPSSFLPQKLICLSMQHSNFKRLWNNALPLKDLKIIDLAYSLKLETTPDFGNSKSVKRLVFYGCERLVEVHPSITDLTDLYYLGIRGCSQLKELAEPTGQLNELSHLKRSPEHINQWASMSSLYLRLCSNLRHLPKQLGDMKGLKLIDASYTAIEELPDSITHLKGLLQLTLDNCKKLRKLPEDIGNMEALQIFLASDTEIEQLPDSFVRLINLEILRLYYCKNLRNLPNEICNLKLLKNLDLNHCSKLERLPDELGNMQCLEILRACYTAIEVVPDSIQLLSRLRVLAVAKSSKHLSVPNSIWKLTSLTELYLQESGIGGRNNLPDIVKNSKLEVLCLYCDVRLWLPMLQSLSSLKHVQFCDTSEGESSSSAEPISFSEFYSLHCLELHSFRSFGSLFLELPPNLQELCLRKNATLIHLPDLSDLKQLKRLDIVGYHSLESLPPLPPHLQTLGVYDCRSLQVTSDMSMLKELSVNWFSYSGERILYFDTPPLLEDNFLGLALLVLCKSSFKFVFNMKVVVTNETNGAARCYWIRAYPSAQGELYSVARCISRDQISITSGDRIKISFERQRYDERIVKVEMCALRVILKTSLTPDFPSFLNNLIKGF